ncbi:MAG: transcriptional repressor [Acidovorax sp.]
MNEANMITRLRNARMHLHHAHRVMQVLQEAEPEPLGAEDAYRRMSERGTRTSLGTVYRTTQELAAHGLLLREWSRPRKAVYRVTPSGFDTHRLRLVCQDCGHSVAFSYGALLTALERVAHAQELVLPPRQWRSLVNAEGAANKSL